ncbi:MAG TPA: anti-sigma factor [Blastocatellia bacterium]|nr:anti-sigma factor [Blastocatellia bacterium]
MVCKQCQELLSDYIDGLLELGEQTKVETHLADCEPCRAVRDDLLQIVHFSHQLPEQAPSTALWSRIQTELAQEQRAGAASRLGLWWARLRARHFNLSLPQLAASAAALTIILSIGIIAFRRDSTAMPASGPAVNGAVDRLSSPEFDALEQQINRLSESIEQKKSAWTPELRDAYERNLIHVNQSLAECRHQIHDNPADDTTQELMLDAYREKVRLLEGFQNF